VKTARVLDFLKDGLPGFRVHAIGSSVVLVMGVV